MSIHSCGYHCDRPRCIKAQRDDLVKKFIVNARKPLTKDEIELAYQEVWRSLPSDFSYTSYDWIEQGIRYAEKAHGIGGEHE